MKYQVHDDGDTVRITLLNPQGGPSEVFISPNMVTVAWDGLGTATAIPEALDPVVRIANDLYDDRRVVDVCIWSDINDESPTHEVYLEGARLEMREVLDDPDDGEANVCHYYDHTMEDNDDNDGVSLVELCDECARTREDEGVVSFASTNTEPQQCAICGKWGTTSERPAWC